MKILVLGLLFTCPLFLQAQAALPVHTVPKEDQHEKWQPQALMLMDERAAMPFSQAWAAMEQGRFLTLEQTSLPGYLSFGHWVYWMAFVLDNPSPDTLRFVVEIAGQDTIWVKNGSATNQVIGAPSPFPSRDRLGLLADPLFYGQTYAIGPLQRDTLLLKRSLIKPVRYLAPRFSTPQTYVAFRQQDALHPNLVHSFFLGAVGIIMIFVFAQYAQQRDAALLWYGCYLFSLLFVNWRLIEEWNPRFSATMYLAPWAWTKIFHTAAHYCTYTLFVYHFLKQGGESPGFMEWVRRFVLRFSLLVCLTELLLLTSHLQHESWLLYMGYRGVFTAFSLVVLSLLWRERSVLAQLVFLGTIFALVGEVASLFLPSPFSSYAGASGTLMEVLVFTTAFIYRNRLFQEAYQLLQTEHIAQVRENEQLARREEIEAFKNRFYANITHEFRTPLTIMLGMAQSLRENPDAEAREAGRLVERNGQNLLGLVNQLLDLSKIESGALQLQPEPGDVMQFIKVVTESFDSLAIGKNQHLSVKTQPEHFVTAFDPARFQQILANLIGNALKYTPEGGAIEVRAALIGYEAPVIHQNGETAILEMEVRDNGIGIPTEKQPQLFDRFYRVENGAGREEGTGIGLALVKELVTLMEGEVQVESAGGQGSVFRVRLPVSNDEVRMMNDELGILHTSTSINQTTTEAPHSSFIVHHSSFPLLLLVEDNADLTDYLSGLLGREYQLISAKNGLAGLEKAFEHLPDIVLSDVMMPGMDGLEFCRTLKNDLRTSHIPVVMLTARATTGDKIEGLQHGADAWLTKPFDQRELFATLQAVQESRRRLRAYFQEMPAKPLQNDFAYLVEKESEFLRLAWASIDAHLTDESYDIGRLCQDLTMSRTNLHRKLTALSGQSASHFIRSRRLTHAVQLLETTDLTMAEISFRTGFSDPTWFSRCFGEAFGQTPGAWRKRRHLEQ
ncbi:MAG: response regulator [Saprospiraceae bacterium]|nr:response regulator [Saprospiraceae bacterium]